MHVDGLVPLNVTEALIIGLVNPRATDTDMIHNVDGLTLENTGAFLEYDGEPLPW